MIMADERVMLAYAWDGVQLQDGHGFPLRIYIPDLHGMKQPQMDRVHRGHGPNWEPGYWVVRGWDKVAKMKATSVIDTVPGCDDHHHADQQKLVPIGGIAHAGSRGISRVEVRVDGGLAGGRDQNAFVANDVGDLAVWTGRSNRANTPSGALL